MPSTDEMRCKQWWPFWEMAQFNIDIMCVHSSSLGQKFGDFRRHWDVAAGLRVVGGRLELTGGKVERRPFLASKAVIFGVNFTDLHILFVGK
jgi:hypothetical protein